MQAEIAGQREPTSGPVHTWTLRPVPGAVCAVGYAVVKRDYDGLLRDIGRLARRRAVSSCYVRCQTVVAIVLV